MCPPTGWTEQELTAELRSRKKAEFDPDTGKGFSAVYTMGDSRFHYVQKVFEDFEFDKHGEIVTTLSIHSFGANFHLVHNRLKVDVTPISINSVKKLVG